MARDKFAQQSLGALHGRIKEARVLMVGAGGIGCELLKNLVLTGFGDVTVVDLDTIDLSNLNRQFLFRSEHIKQSKAEVARESAARFNPAPKLTAHHDNIKAPRFNVAWFRGFDVVFNALDNLDARRHVNRMCLAADVPLVESGTTGFNGQVQVIRKGATECYDCTPKDPPKSFPVCTIRSTPSQPIHCIVWAKSYLFAELFGATEDDAPELNTAEDADNRDEIAKLRSEAQALLRLREAMGAADFPRRVFDKVFKADIERLRSMEDMWKTKRAPEALDYDTLLQASRGCAPAVASRDQVVWSTAENFAVFLDSLRRLSARLGELPLTFDKDDVDTLDFVAASANLRSHVFGIETRSKFDIKQMAGNIIPAIATTNAMTAGLCVLEAFKVLRSQLQRAKFSFLTRSTERVIATESLQPPNPHCATCGVACATLVVDTKRAKLGDLVEAVKAQLGYEDFSVSREDAKLLYDPDEDVFLDKTFAELEIKPDTFITVSDESDEDARVDLLLSVTEQESDQDAPPLTLPDKVAIAKKPKKPAAETNGDHKIDATMHNGTNGTNGTTGATKRKASDAGLGTGEVDMVRKKGKVMEAAAKEDAVVVIEDDGAIVLD